MGLINIPNIPERTFLRKSSSGGLGLLYFRGFGFVFNKQQTLQMVSG